MNQPTVELVVVPARLGSSRLPGKPLRDLGGESLLSRVLAAVARALPGVPRVVATEDPAIVEEAGRCGVAGLLTGPCATGSDRCAAVLHAFPEARWVLNWQGDEPGLSRVALEALFAGARATPAADLWTAVSAVRGPVEGPGVWAVGAGRDLTGRALLFSRSAIPATPRGPAPRWLHRGVYLYRRAALARFAALPPHPLEQLESLEQLRALAAGLHIELVETPGWEPGVDWPADLERWRTRLADSGVRWT